MFRSKRTKAIDALAAEIIRLVQWLPMPVTVFQVAEQVQEKLARVGMVVSLREACKRTERQYRRMSK